jgi:hypothetical protein
MVTPATVAIGFRGARQRQDGAADHEGGEGGGDELTHWTLLKLKAVGAD